MKRRTFFSTIAAAIGVAKIDKPICETVEITTWSAVLKWRQVDPSEMGVYESLSGTGDNLAEEDARKIAADLLERFA